jgi:peptide/nickel transport system substrate-binding protein
LAITVVLSLLLAACAPTPEPEVIEKEVVVTKEVEKVVEKEVVVTQEVEKIVEKEVVVTQEVEKVVEKEVVVTATPIPPPAPKTGGVLIGARISDMVGLDPHTSPAFASRRIFELVYNTLVRFDENMAVAPELAESWEISDDGLTVTFKLRPGVTFHNGDELTSEDIKYNFERILDEETGAVSRSFFVGISEIEAPDPLTVVMKLEGPNAALLNNMANSSASIVSKKLGEAGELDKELIGTGPFKLAEWEPDNFMRFEANRDFFLEGVPLLDGIEMRVIPDESSILAGLRAGTIDWAQIDDPRVAILASGEESLNTTRAPALSYHLFGLNSAREPFTDERVRQAISCAIDRQQIIDVASLGEGQLTGPVTNPFFGVSPSEYACYTPDLEKARDLLAEAGYADGFSFKIMVPSAEPPTALADAQSIQSQLEQIGIEAEIELLELGIYVDRWLAGDMDAWVGLNSGAPDPDFMLYRYWHNTGGLNFVPGWNDPEVDALLDQGKAVTDPEERKAIYAEAQKRLVEAAPWIWTYVGYEYRPMQDYVKGFTPMSDGSYIYLRDVWLDK